MSTAIELESFEETLNFARSQAENPAALMDRLSDMVSAVEWGLFDAPELVDRAHLPLVYGGVKNLIGDLGYIVGLAEDGGDHSESEYALYKICDWRAQSRDIIGSWLRGWWTHNDMGEIEKTPVLAALDDGLRVLQFAGWWLWRFYISPSGNRLRGQCASVTIVPPPPTPVEEPDQAPPPSDPYPPVGDESLPQQKCANIAELAAFMGVKFGEPCPAEVMHAYQTRLDYASYDTDTRWDLARCYARQKEYQQAIKAYETVLQDRPEFHEARKEMILCLAASQQWDAAEAEARYLKGFAHMRPDAELALSCLQSLRQQAQN